MFPCAYAPSPSSLSSSFIPFLGKEVGSGLWILLKPGETEENHQIYELRLSVSESGLEPGKVIPWCLTKQTRHTDVQTTEGIAPRILKPFQKKALIRLLVPRWRRRKRIKETRIADEEERAEQKEEGKRAREDKKDKKRRKNIRRRRRWKGKWMRRRTIRTRIIRRRRLSK
jgi:hypothetical protein